MFDINREKRGTLLYIFRSSNGSRDYWPNKKRYDLYTLFVGLPRLKENIKFTKGNTNLCKKPCKIHAFRHNFPLYNDFNYFIVTVHVLCIIIKYRINMPGKCPKKYIIIKKCGFFLVKPCRCKMTKNTIYNNIIKCILCPMGFIRFYLHNENLKR